MSTSFQSQVRRDEKLAALGRWLKSKGFVEQISGLVSIYQGARFDIDIGVLKRQVSYCPDVQYLRIELHMHDIVSQEIEHALNAEGTLNHFNHFNTQGGAVSLSPGREVTWGESLDWKVVGLGEQSIIALVEGSLARGQAVIKDFFLSLDLHPIQGGEEETGDAANVVNGE